MGLFDALVDVVAMPLRVAVDVVKLPGKIVNVRVPHDAACYLDF